MKKVTITYNEQREDVNTRIQRASHAEALILLDVATDRLCEELGLPREQALAIAYNSWDEAVLFNESEDMEGEEK